MFPAFAIKCPGHQMQAALSVVSACLLTSEHLQCHWVVKKLAHCNSILQNPLTECAHCASTLVFYRHTANADKASHELKKAGHQAQESAEKAAKKTGGFFNRKSHEAVDSAKSAVPSLKVNSFPEVAVGQGGRRKSTPSLWPSSANITSCCGFTH
jgi:hypothetical protein